MDPVTISVIGLGGLAGALATALGIADRYLRVETDPRVEQIVDILPSANCGGCGAPGCRAYAEAVVAGATTPDKCAPGGPDTAVEIAEIMGVDVGEIVKRVAVVHCRAGGEIRRNRALYVGPHSCTLNNALGGDTSCTWGCLGLGECVDACTFGAMVMRDGLPHVDAEACTGCGACAEVCPRGVIGIEAVDPEQGVVYVACNSRDKGALAKAVCDVSCLGCGICARKSENDLFRVVDFLAIANPEAIRAHPDEADDLIGKCPRDSIVRDLARERASVDDAA